MPVSSPEQVKTAISLVKPKLTEWLKVYQIHFNSMTSEAAISKLYKDFYAPHSGSKDAVSIWGINNSRFVIKDDEPCIDLRGYEKEAAVLEKAEPGAPICFSVLKLRRIPPDQLERQITALAAHELTHQILRSLDEEGPLAIQKQVLATYNWAVIGQDVVCNVDTFKTYNEEVIGYQINFGFLLDCSGGCGTGFTFSKNELSRYLELAREKRTDPIGRSVGCTVFKFR